MGESRTRFFYVLKADKVEREARGGEDAVVEGERGSGQRVRQFHRSRTKAVGKKKRDGETDNALARTIKAANAVYIRDLSKLRQTGTIGGQSTFLQ